MLTDPDVTWGSGRGCPLVVHYWVDLQSVHGLRCYGNACCVHDVICNEAVPFRPYCGGVVTRTRNVSEYMLETRSMPSLVCLPLA